MKVETMSAKSLLNDVFLFFNYSILCYFAYSYQHADGINLIPGSIQANRLIAELLEQREDSCSNSISKLAIRTPKES